MRSPPPLPYPPPTRALQAGGCCLQAGGCCLQPAALPEPLSQLHLQVLSPGCACTELTQLPGAWISKWATLVMLGLLSPWPSGPFRRVPALGCDTGVPIHPAVPLSAPPRRAFSCFRPPRSLNRSGRSFLSSFRSSLETGFHQDTEEKFIV